MKFEFIWSSGFRGEYVDGQPDAGVIGILIITHLRAFISGELKKVMIYSPLLKIIMLADTHLHTQSVKPQQKFSAEIIIEAPTTKVLTQIRLLQRSSLIWIHTVCP